MRYSSRKENAVFIREKRNRPETLTGIHFQRETSLHYTPLTSLSTKQTTLLAAKKIYAHVIMT